MVNQTKHQIPFSVGFIA